MERVVHRRGREQKDLLFSTRAFHEVQQLPVTGGGSAVLAHTAGIAEMVCFVDYDGVSHFLDALEAVGVVATSAQIGMAEYDQAAEIAGAGATHMRQVVAQSPLPNVNPSGLGNE